MVRTDSIGKNVVMPQQNYYSGVKIDIHNPTVNVPNNNGEYAKPDFKIYQYDTKPINTYQPPYIPTIKTIPTQQKPKAEEVKNNIPTLPKAQPVKELPESVLEPIRNIEIPEPVYVNLPNAEQKKAPQNNVTISPEIIEPTNENLQTPVIEAIKSEDTKENKPEIITNENIQASNIEQQNKNTINNIEQPAITQTPPEENKVIKSPIEIVPPVTNPTPIVDYNKVTENLNSPNYDTQALQLEEIVEAASANNKENIGHYLKEQIFLDIINIVTKDASALPGPTEAQGKIRAQIIENYMAQLNQEKSGAKEFVYPHKLSEEDINYANSLSPRELAERNREYAIKTLALLSKEFTNQVEAESGVIVPITDVPGMSAIVNSLKNENFAIRLVALGALAYIQRPEYENELRPIYEALIHSEKDITVRNAAEYVLNELATMNTSQAAA